MATHAHVHLIRRNEISRLLHDSRFWAIVGIIAFIAAFTALVIWAAQQGPPAGVPQHMYPYPPYFSPGPYPMPLP